MVPVGSPKVNWVRGQTKYGSKYSMRNRGVRQETLLEEARGPRPEPGLNGGPVSKRLVAGSARKSNMALLPLASRGPTIRWVRCNMGGSGGDGPRQPRPGRQRLTLGTWNVTPPGGKEPELVQEVDRYWLDLVGLASTHSIGSGSKLLERGWTLVAKGVRRRADVGILTSPRLSAAVLEFTPVDERVASLRLRAGRKTLTVVCAYALGLQLTTNLIID